MRSTIATPAIPLNGGDADLRRFASSLPTWQALRTFASPESLSARTVAAQETFARATRKGTRTESGGYRRDHQRVLAQRVEVDAKEIRIMGSKSVLLRTLVAASSAKSAGFGR